ncbi:MAG: molybdopterin synthase catalytic subunit MoaE [Oceanospirillaceae bacterium]
MIKNWIKIQEEDFNQGALIEWLQSNDDNYGALVTFTGVVRDSYTQDLDKMFLEHYPGMTENCLQNIIAQARKRWQLGPVCIVHRVGELEKKDNIVFIGVISAHRVAAFEASQFIMDYLKKDAPFWKKEMTETADVWVEQKESDLMAADKWSNNTESSK